MSASLQTPIVEQLAWCAAQEARERNENSFRSTVDFKELPQSSRVAYQALADRVLVTATDMDVLAEWLYVQGGAVSRMDLPSGQTVWTLCTSTWTDSPARFPRVPVFVTVVQASDVPVMQEIREAVKAA